MQFFNCFCSADFHPRIIHVDQLCDAFGMSDDFLSESCKNILVNKGVYWCKLPLRADATVGCAPNKHKHILNRTTLWKSVDVQGSEWKPLTWPCHGVVEIVSCHRGYRRRGDVPSRVGMPTPGRVSQPFRIRSFTRPRRSRNVQETADMNDNDTFHIWRSLGPAPRTARVVPPHHFTTCSPNQVALPSARAKKRA